MTTIAERTKLIKPSVTLPSPPRQANSGRKELTWSISLPASLISDTPGSHQSSGCRGSAQRHDEVHGREGHRAAAQSLFYKYEREHGLSYRKEDVLVSCGAKHSIYNVLQAIVNPGDEILIRHPTG